jgi:hypothetical protein
MKKHCLIFFNILVIGIKAFCQTGFSTNATNWSLPAGGKVLNNHNFGFNNINYVGSSSSIGNQSWVTMDINGDNKQDLIVVAQINGNFYDCFEVGTNPHWKVYLNNGNSMSNTALEWELPAGGRIINGHNYGFNNIEGTASAYAGNQSWFVRDMNGDNKVDLVVSAESNGTYTDCFGLTSTPYWKVYLNNGVSFSNIAINWNLPTGGKTDGTHLYGYNEAGYTASNTGDPTWETKDMNGDKKPDLLITSEVSSAGYNDCFGLGSGAYWKVYLNSGTGFSTSATNFYLPSGGAISNGHSSGFWNTFNLNTGSPGNQMWSLMDMNGDAKYDLVVMSESDGTFTDCYGAGTNPFWKVYWNSGTSFSNTAFNWPLPFGGKTLNGHTYGFNDIDNNASASIGNQSWTVSDINGDERPDLIIHAESDGTFTNCFGVGSNPYWKVYLNSGSGFSGIVSNWTVPLGGEISSSNNYGFNYISNIGNGYIGNQTWETFDINGDKKADLVVLAQSDGIYSDCFGIGSSPYWKVYINNATQSAVNEVINEKVEVTISPNPFEKIFSIKLSESENYHHRMMIYNIQGQLVQQMMINSSQEEVELDIPSGIYFYSIFDRENKSIANGKLVKK